MGRGSKRRQREPSRRHLHHGDQGERKGRKEGRVGRIVDCQASGKLLSPSPSMGSSASHWIGSALLPALCSALTRRSLREARLWYKREVDSEGQKMGMTPYCIISCVISSYIIELIMLSNVSGTFSWPPKITIKKLALCILIRHSKLLCQI